MAPSSGRPPAAAWLGQAILGEGGGRPARVGSASPAPTSHPPTKLCCKGSSSYTLRACRRTGRPRYHSGRTARLLLGAVAAHSETGQSGTYNPGPSQTPPCVKDKRGGRSRAEQVHRVPPELEGANSWWPGRHSQQKVDLRRIHPRLTQVSINAHPVGAKLQLLKPTSEKSSIALRPLIHS